MKAYRSAKAIFVGLLVTFLILNAFVIPVAADGPDIPKATKEFYCNDFANVLNQTTENQIVSIGESTYKASNGGQVVFVSIDSLKDSTIEEYANTLFNKWKIGTKDRGILFIISMEEREAKIEVGYGYEGELTDIESYNLLQKFSQINSAEGMDKAVLTIYKDLSLIARGEKGSVQYPEYSYDNNKSYSDGERVLAFVLEHPIFFVIILILIILDLVLTRGRITWFILRMLAASARKGGGGGGRNSGGGGRSGGGGASSRF